MKFQQIGKLTMKKKRNIKNSLHMHLSPLSLSPPLLFHFPQNVTAPLLLHALCKTIETISQQQQNICGHRKGERRREFWKRVVVIVVVAFVIVVQPGNVQIYMCMYVHMYALMYIAQEICCWETWHLISA